MEILHSKFTFYRAGQGAFYGGQIFSPSQNRAWNIVYDCGTSNWIKGNSQSLNAEIIRFGEGHMVPVSEIDILFISHLDYDHVSHVLNLITKYPAKRIVIPYIPKEQRDFALVSFGPDPDGDAGLSPEDYASFLDNPYSFLRERSKEAEIFIVSGGKDIDYLDYEGDNNPESNSDLIPVGTPDNAPLEFSGSGGQSFRFYRNNLQFFYRKYWEFTSFVQSISIDEFENLKRCLKKKAGIGEDEAFELPQLQTLITTDRKKAHDCYKKHLSDVNAHGLVLLQGPLNYESINGRSFSESVYRHRRWLHREYEDLHDEFMFHHRIPSCATLLMGDTSIKPNNNPILFSEGFKDKLRRVIVFQVPHHGSAKNWNHHEYRQLIPWHPYIINVCNFGYGNTYGHPSHEVIDYLGGWLVMNSQFKSFSTELKVYYP